MSTLREELGEVFANQIADSADQPMSPRRAFVGHLVYASGITIDGALIWVCWNHVSRAAAVGLAILWLTHFAIVRMLITGYRSCRERGLLTRAEVDG